MKNINPGGPLGKRITKNQIKKAYDAAYRLAASCVFCGKETCAHPVK